MAIHYSNNQQSYDSPRRNQVLRTSPIILFSILGLLIFGLTIRQTIESLLLGNHQNEFLLIFILTMYFPLTYIAYYLVHRQRRITRLQEDMHLLGYGKRDSKELVENVELYDKAHSPFSYILFISLSVLLCITGLSLFFLTPDKTTFDSLSISFNVNTLQAMRYGFLGAYVFSAYLLYRRYSTNDLQPSVYLYCAFTLTAGIAFNYVAFEAVANMAKATENTPADGIGAGLIAILAFSIGYFPYLAVRWFNKLAHSTFQVGERRADSLPLSIIDGISDWHETRLRDNGIDDVQNLASVEIVDLLINTAFGAQQIISWVDQAILYQYLDQSEIDSFRRGKINMLSDFWEQVESNDGTPISSDEMLVLATSLQTTSDKLKNLKRSTENGPNTHRVKDYWWRVTKESKKEKEAPLEPTGGFLLPEKDVNSTTSLKETFETPIDQSQELPFDYYFLNHTSFLEKKDGIIDQEKQAKYRNRTHVERDHYCIKVIVDSYYSGALDRIERVEYILHKSYPNPRQVSDTRVDKFLLKELANGQFVLMAQVFMKDRKEPVRLQRFITLWESGPKLP